MPLISNHNQGTALSRIKPEHFDLAKRCPLMSNFSWRMAEISEIFKFRETDSSFHHAATKSVLSDSVWFWKNNQHSKGAPWSGKADKNGFLPISQHYIYADGRNNRYIAIFFCETVISQKGGDPLQGKESEKKIMALFSKVRTYSEATERCSVGFTFTSMLW